MAHNTLIAQLIFPEPQRMENRLNVEAYNRSGAFAQDYHSKNWLDFGYRWFNLPSYKEMYDFIREYYSSNIPMGQVQYFDTSQDNTIYAFGPRKESKTIQMPTRTAIEYANNHNAHYIKPYKKFKDDISKIFEIESDNFFQNRPDVMVKKELIGVERI